MEKFKLITFEVPNQGNWGILYSDGEKEICRTLERPWKSNKRGESCIPSGKYKVVADNTGKYRYWKVLDVPGRDFIEIHGGNYVRHSDGCILFGEEWMIYKNEMSLMNPISKSMSKAMDNYKKILPKEFELEIIRHLSNEENNR